LTLYGYLYVLILLRKGKEVLLVYDTCNVSLPNVKFQFRHHTQPVNQSVPSIESNNDNNDKYQPTFQCQYVDIQFQSQPQSQNPPTNTKSLRSRSKSSQGFSLLQEYEYNPIGSGLAAVRLVYLRYIMTYVCIFEKLHIE
jgi:hypothetical protein